LGEVAIVLEAFEKQLPFLNCQFPIAIGKSKEFSICHFPFAIFHWFD